jgi:hypothetical protein
VKTDRKLVACSVLTFIIGICAITPLLFMMPNAAKADIASSQPWFNLDVPYTYWTANSTKNSNGTVTYGEWYLTLFNVSLNSAAVQQAVDARIEYFQIQVYTDKAPIENLTYFVGTNRTAAFDSIESSFHFIRDNWFDTNTSGGGMFGGDFSGNEFGGMSGTNAGLCPLSNWLNSTVSQRIFNIENAKAIYLDIRRLGSVILDGNITTAILSSNEVIQHFELKKFGEGFLYNNMIPENQLPQTNLLSPQFVLENEP